MHRDDVGPLGHQLNDFLTSLGVGMPADHATRIRFTRSRYRLINGYSSIFCFFESSQQGNLRSEDLNTCCLKCLADFTGCFGLTGVDLYQ